MFSLKQYILQLLNEEEPNPLLPKSTLLDEFYLNCKDEIDSKILELWDQYQYEKKDSASSNNHFSSN